MRIEILGTKGEIPDSRQYHRKQSGVLIDGKLLLDVGEKSYLQYYPKWILITHFHPDHAFFVRKGFEESPETDALIYAPDRVPISSNIHVLEGEITLGPFSITAIPTHHSKRVKSQAYLIKKGRCSLLYTGDLVWIDKRYHSLFQNVDVVITEASFLRKGGLVKKDQETGKLFGHNGLPNLVHLFSKYTKKLVLIHFGSWFYKNIKESRKKIAQLGKENGIEILTGYDGLILDLLK